MNRPGNLDSAEPTVLFRLKNDYPLHGEGRVPRKLGFAERFTGDNGRYQLFLKQ